MQRVPVFGFLRRPPAKELDSGRGDRIMNVGVGDLSPEQRAVVESWGEGMAVLAGAGSGKTTTLVVKCAELLRKSPGARFAAVSFTERSAGDLREKLSAALGSLNGHGVMTI